MISRDVQKTIDRALRTSNPSVLLPLIDHPELSGDENDAVWEAYGDIHEQWSEADRREWARGRDAR